MKVLTFSIAGLKTSLYDCIAIFSCAIFAIFASIVSVIRFRQFEVFFYDFGIFDQAIWKVSQFKAPIIDHYVIGGKWIFADHFSPGIFLLSPLYWITQNSEILLVAQAVIVAIAGFILYLTGKLILKQQSFALAALLCFYAFIGTQNAVISDFHEVTVSTLPLALLFYFFFNKRKALYFVSFLVLLSFKESLFLLGVCIGITTIFLRKEFWKEGLLTIILSLMWGYISIKLVIPAFSGGIYQYTAPAPAGILSPVTALFDSSVKIRTMLYSFFSFGFLPLLSLSFYPVIIQDFFIRFYPNWPTRWDLGLHYSSQLGVLLTLATLVVGQFLEKSSLFKAYIGIVSFGLIMNAAFLYAFILHGPLALAYNPAFYTHTKDFSFLNKLIELVPANASVMTHNNLAVRFTHQELYLLRQNYEQYKPDYIVIDKRTGQSPNNFFGSADPSEIVKKIASDPMYGLLYRTDEQFIFKRK
jgi:uncharacterized membrane protein